MARWKCPNCGSDQVEVAITTWAKLIQTGDDPLGEDNEFQTDTDEANSHDHEWDGSSSMLCQDCAHIGTVQDFEISTDEDLEERCAGCGKKYDGCGDGYDGYCPECADKRESHDPTDSPDYIKHEEGLT